MSGRRRLRPLMRLLHTVMVVLLVLAGIAGSLTSSFSEVGSVQALTASQVVLTSAPNPSFCGQPVTFQASVGNIPPIDPSVTFTPTNTPTNTLTPTGTSTLTITLTPTGTSTLTITLTPTATSTLTTTLTPTATSTLTTTLTPTATPTITLTATGTATSTVTSTPTVTPDPVVANRADKTPAGTDLVALQELDTATPTPTPTTTNTPTPTYTVTAIPTPGGQVDFTVNGTPVATDIALVARQATWIANTLVAGTHVIGAVYKGDAVYDLSVATPINQTVNMADVVVTVPTPTTVAVGQSLALSVVVSAKAPSSSIPTGKVTFKEGANILGTPALDATGKATQEVMFTSIGQRQITLRYDGDSCFNPSQEMTTTVIAQETDLELFFENFEDLEEPFPLKNRWRLEGLPNWYASTCSPQPSGGGSKTGSPSLPGTCQYQDTQESWMIIGPISLVNATRATLEFDVLRGTRAEDVLWAVVSIDGKSFKGRPYPGVSSPSWSPKETIDLNQVDELGSVLGRRQVWIGFFFKSDGTGIGVSPAIDNIRLSARISGTTDSVPCPASTGNAVKWYFAEGSTGFTSNTTSVKHQFDEFLTIMNPNTTATVIRVTYYLTDGSTRVYERPVPGQSRTTIKVNDPPENGGLGPNRAASATVESVNEPGPSCSDLVVERPMYFNYNAHSPPGQTGGHNAIGATNLSQSWYFAEGFTGQGFDEYLTILNPGPAGRATISYYVERETAPRTSTIDLTANSRTTIAVHDSLGRLPAGHATKIESTVPVVVERPMYFQYSGTINGGHNVIGATNLSQSWYFAEGFTGQGFDEYLTIFNPGAAGTATISYYVEREAAPRTSTLNLEANSRTTIPVHGSGLNSLGRLTDGHATRIESTVPVVVERPMYFTYGNDITDGHTVMGANATNKVWRFAEGFTNTGFDEYLTIFNPGVAGTATVSYFLEGQVTPIARTVPLASNSRTTIAVHAPYDATTSPYSLGRFSVGHSTRVESSVPVVVERPMYFQYGETINGGHNVIGFSPR